MSTAMSTCSTTQSLHHTSVSLKRRVIGFAVLACIAGAVALIAFRSRSREPSYQGKPLSAWIKVYVDEGEEGHEGADAIRQIGTNAIPHLMKWVAYQEPSSRPIPELVTWGMNRLPDSMQSKVPEAITKLADGDWEFYRAESAPWGFAALGTMATQAVPSLETLIQNRAQPNTSRRAMFSLAAISTDIPPIIVARLSDPQSPDRLFALIAIGKHSPSVIDGRKALPELLECLQDTNSFVRYWTARALGRMNEPTEFLVPALSNALNDTSKHVRGEATNALQRIAPEILTNAPSQ